VHCRRRGFTLIELLVVITIMGILAGMVMGALQMAQTSAREAATKATITKLNNIIMRRYESYITRRVPISIPVGTPAKTVAALRLYAIRTLMQMEMPDALSDINGYTVSNGTVSISSGTVTMPPTNTVAYTTMSVPALYSLYSASVGQMTTTYESAQCLYKIVSMGSPEAMEQFNQSEIGMTSDGKPVFIDAWGTPICWLRWAPGYSAMLSPPAPSDIQSGAPSDDDSDPFDPRRIDYDASTTAPKGFHLIPLICSAGPDKTFGLLGFPTSSNPARDPTYVVKMVSGTGAIGTPDVYQNLKIGQPDTSGSAYYDNITNHHIEAR
jgi:prepilin-type N-terminal cleavage/methylation domain-containing protein